MADLVVALDVPGRKEALELANKMCGIVSWLKVGLQLFISAGPVIIEELKKRNFNIFLDLKLYDIPNTVAGAVAECANLEVDMLTIHLQGGRRMCESALEAINPGCRLKLIGVTVLTSFERGEMPGINSPPDEFGFELATLAFLNSLPGIVCSGFEVARIKNSFPDLLCVCPGIRPGKIQEDDQRRAMTPGCAIKAGADFIVVGRPILLSDNPVLAAAKIKNEINAKERLH